MKCKTCGHKLYKDELGEFFHNTSELTYCKQCHPIINNKMIKCGCMNPEPKQAGVQGK